MTCGPIIIAAKLVGRWRDGSSLVRNPYYPLPPGSRRSGPSDAIGARPRKALPRRPPSPPPAKRSAPRRRGPKPDRTQATAIAPPTEPSFKGDNDFLFGIEDPEALRCPFGAHIRRANPRDIAGARIDGAGLDLEPAPHLSGRARSTSRRKGANPGLLFMCLNGDIERQFEFIQQTWLVSPAFHGLVGEQDPLNSNAGPDSTGYRGAQP